MEVWKCNYYSKGFLAIVHKMTMYDIEASQ